MPSTTMEQIDLRDLDKEITKFVQKLPVHASGDYPSVKPSGKNQSDAEALLDAFASGLKAEMTAVAQYTNHHFAFGQEPDSDLELGIALTEMLHLELLGELIENLGADPRFWRKDKTYWSGDNVTYGGDKCSLLKADVESERAAIEGYRQLLTVVKTPEAVDLIRRIVEDEKVHLQLFEKAYEAGCGGVPRS